MTAKYKLRRTKVRLNNFLARKCLSSYSTMISICLVVVAVDEECSEGPSYLGLGNDELHPQDLNALDRAVTSAREARGGRGSSDECDDEVMKILCLLFLQRMRIKIRTW